MTQPQPAQQQVDMLKAGAAATAAAQVLEDQIKAANAALATQPHAVTPSAAGTQQLPQDG